MTEMPSYAVENPSFETYKPKKQNYLYSSLLPIFLSILTYILIFHVLEVSPSSIFNDTKILFFISNALILIIAADYGAFAVKEKHDFYGEYMAATRRENPRLGNYGYGMSLAEDVMKKREKQVTTRAKDAPRYLLHKEVEVPEKTVQVVSEIKPRNKSIEKHETSTEKNGHITARNGETCEERKLMNPKPYGRSKSDKARSERRRKDNKQKTKSYVRSQSDSSKWMVVRKVKKAEEAEEKWENVREESEEFSKMTNEELNRRVEDFIRFNKDIKRQSFV